MLSQAKQKRVGESEREDPGQAGRGRERVGGGGRKESKQVKWESIKSLFAPFVVIAYTVSFDRLRFPLWLFEVGPQCVIVSQLAAAAFRSTNHDSVD